jgi:hypothetical protein
LLARHPTNKTQPPRANIVFWEKHYTFAHIIHPYPQLNTQPTLIFYVVQISLTLFAIQTVRNQNNEPPIYQSKQEMGQSK